MNARVLLIGLVLIALIVPAQATGGGSGVGGGGHGGGGHSGGHGGGRGFHFGRHGRGKAGRGSVGIANSVQAAHLQSIPRITTVASFGSVPGFRVGFAADSFLCPLTPHRIAPVCPVCTFPGPLGLRPGFFGFFGFGLIGGGPWFGFDDESPEFAVSSPVPAENRRKLPVLVFTNGWSFEVTDYGIDDEGELRYVTSYGGLNIVPLNTLDLYATVKANQKLGISFTLKMEHEP